MQKFLPYSSVYHWVRSQQSNCAPLLPANFSTRAVTILLLLHTACISLYTIPMECSLYHVCTELVQHPWYSYRICTLTMYYISKCDHTLSLISHYGPGLCSPPQYNTLKTHQFLLGTVSLVAAFHCTHSPTHNGIYPVTLDHQNISSSNSNLMVFWVVMEWSPTHDQEGRKDL